MPSIPAGATRSFLFLVCFSAFTVASAAGLTIPMGASTQIPAAQGEVRINTTRNGNTQIRMNVKHLAPPGRITPGAVVFVVWARGLAAGSEPQNLGALRVDKNLSGRLTAVTAMSGFDLFLTCEQAQAVTVPAADELLPAHYPGK